MGDRSTHNSRIVCPGGVVGAKISRDYAHVTLWIDRPERTAISAGGIALPIDKLEQLIWRLAELRSHMAHMQSLRAAKVAKARDGEAAPPKPPTTPPKREPTGKPSLRSSHRGRP
jgi:hypothetical protein